MKIILIMLLLISVFALVMIKKWKVTLDNHNKIHDAQGRYVKEQISNGTWDYGNRRKNNYGGNFYKQRETFNKTWFRLWDWGYENILPKETYEKIKSYIE